MIASNAGTISRRIPSRRLRRGEEDTRCDTSMSLSLRSDEAGQDQQLYHEGPMSYHKSHKPNSVTAERNFASSVLRISNWMTRQVHWVASMPFLPREKRGDVFGKKKRGVVVECTTMQSRMFCRVCAGFVLVQILLALIRTVSTAVRSSKWSDKGYGSGEHIVPTGGGRRSWDDPGVTILLSSTRNTRSGRRKRARLVPSVIPAPTPSKKGRQQLPDFGGLVVSSGERKGGERSANGETKTTVKHKYEEGGAYRFMEKGRSMAGSWSRLSEPDFAYDDDYRSGALVEGRRSCKRTAFKKAHHPTCNAVHEIDMYGDPTVYIRSGTYRVVWGVRAGSQSQEIVAMKAYLFGDEDFEFDHEFYNDILKDAIVMEKLTSSPRIADAYSHCGTTLMTEVLHRVDTKVMPSKKERKKRKKDDTLQTSLLQPRDKLQLALDMAEALADVHGLSSGVVLHNDLDMSQYLRSEDGKLKLNDFNVAEVMLFNEKEGGYCKFKDGFDKGPNRAPEELMQKFKDEKIDVFSFGNILYSVLSGHEVYVEDADEASNDNSVNFGKIVRGDLPFLDPRYKSSSFADAALVQAIERCWVFDPDQRADIFEIVEHLRGAMAKS